MADPPRARQLLVDVSVLAMHDAGTGIQRVVRALLNELQCRKLRDVVVRPVASQGKVSYRYLPYLASDRPLDAQELAACPEVEVVAGDIFLGLDLATVSLRLHEQQLASWRATGAVLHFLVYDLLPLRHPRWFRRRTRRNFKRWLGVIERQADQVICISKTVAADFDRWHKRFGFFPRRPITVGTIRLGADIEASAPSRGLPADAGPILAWLGRQPTVLMVGTVEPRKGYGRALAAFQHLWSEVRPSTPQLLIVGRPGWKTDRLQRRLRQLSGLDGPFLWLDEVSDEFLGLIYKACAGVLFASDAEGFGLPIVEALDHGKKVLVRDQPVLRELAGPGVTYFPQDTPAYLARAVCEWLDSSQPIGGTAMVRSWKDSASDLLRLLDILPAELGLAEKPPSVAH